MVHLFDQATQNLHSTLARSRLFNQGVQHASTEMIFLQRLASFDRLQDLPAKSRKIDRSFHIQLTLGQHCRIIVVLLVEVQILMAETDWVKHATLHQLVLVHGRIHIIISCHLFVRTECFTWIWMLVLVGGKTCLIWRRLVVGVLLAQRNTCASLFLQPLRELLKILLQPRVLLFKVGNAFFVGTLAFESIYHGGILQILVSRQIQTHRASSPPVNAIFFVSTSESGCMSMRRFRYLARIQILGGRCCVKTLVEPICTCRSISSSINALSISAMSRITFLKSFTLQINFFFLVVLVCDPALFKGDLLLLMMLWVKCCGGVLALLQCRNLLDWPHIFHFLFFLFATSQSHFFFQRVLYFGHFALAGRLRRQLRLVKVQV